MKYFNQFYVPKFLARMRQCLQAMEQPKGVPCFLVGQSPGSRLNQIELDRYLEVAYRHDVLDRNLERRLKSHDWDIFYQAKSELMCAYFLEKIIVGEVTFNPKGDGASVLEFIFSRLNKCIFVEVKSPVKEIGNSFWSGNDSEIIRKNVKRARRQMTPESSNLVIISGDLRVPVSHEIQMIKSLYGEPVQRLSINPEKGEVINTGWDFNPSGLFQPDSNTRISAVATLESSIFFPPKEVKYIFKVYHNPYAKKVIGVDIFQGWPQYIHDVNRGVMDWIDHPESID